MTHIYTAGAQPATGWIDRCDEVEIRGGFGVGEMIWCDCCGQKHPAEDCVVQCYYDGLSVWCAPGKGCKDPVEIARKWLIEHNNRSLAQKARRQRERMAA